MKTILSPTLTLAAALAAALCAANVRSGEINTTKTRIGIYDSRVVAYAWFWNTNHQKQLKGLMHEAQVAKAAGDTKRSKELSATLGAQQAEIHREVFSTAPPTNALAEIKEHLPEIQKAVGVTALVSKWDDTDLKKYPNAERVDVTDALVREFITTTPQQRKTISEMKSAEPLPLKQCEELIRKGEI